tara:strand:- start:24 stop:353 length:330 start_codon:yes stop_codon:yes gene_type:complete
MAQTQFSKKQVYAVQTGDYAGQMFIIVEPNKDSIGCLSIPTMENIQVPVNALEHARNNNIIKYVEKLPRNVFKISAAQYFKNENSGNRREQFNTPNVSYSETTVEEDTD